MHRIALVLALAGCAKQMAATGETPTPAGGERTIPGVTITELVMGDLACYVTFVDASGAEQHVPGLFDLCVGPGDTSPLVGKKATVTIKPDTMADCESIEPCGKTVVVDMVQAITPE
jgi:hypothetical protein